MNILEARDLDVSFFSGKCGTHVHAVDHVSFHVRQGEFLGLVGESGCGKSTVAGILAGLFRPDSGEVMIKGKKMSYPFPRNTYQTLQMIFQLPQDSFNPRCRIGKSLIDMQRNFVIGREDARRNGVKCLEQVGLHAGFMDKYPHQMSGGECQRAAIARAIAVKPEIILCDEVTSALDVSVQAQVTELLRELREKMGLALLFISHDLALVQGICDRILVMHDGAIVESGNAKKVLRHPEHAYTKMLLESVLQ